MIKGDLLQLAEEYGLKQDQGVAYGIIQEYAVTFSNGAGNLRMMIATRFESNDDKDALMQIINRQDLKGLYGIRKLQIAKKVVFVSFTDQPDSKEKIRSFIDWFFPLLEQFEAFPADVCVQCLLPIEEQDVHWVLRDGATAFCMHHTCAEELKKTVSAQNQDFSAKKNGSLAKGILGMLLGTLLSILLWTLLQLIDFYAPIAGMANGWLIVFLYGKMNGSEHKLRIPLMVIIGIFSVILSVLCTYLVVLVQQNTPFSLFFQALATNADTQTGFINMVVIGSIFMALGIFVSLKSITRNTVNLIVTDLE